LSKVTRKSQDLPLTVESTLSAGSTALSALTENSKPPKSIRQKPVLQAVICDTGLASPSAVYTYTYEGEGTFSSPDRLGGWPLLELERYNGGLSGSKDLELVTQTFRRGLSWILHRNMSKLTVEDLRSYELVLSTQEQKVSAENWVADSLHAISACPGMLHKEEGREPSELLAYIQDIAKKTGVCANPYPHCPTVSGYLIDTQGNVICFVSDGEPRG
jgi:hypothetical protein